MKKVIILIIFCLLFAGIVIAQDIQKPINNKIIKPLDVPQHLASYKPNLLDKSVYFYDWEFIQEPTTITGFTNYYDYMPGSFCGHSIMRQPDASGGVYFVFHGQPNTTDNRRVYWAYVYPAGNIEYGTITTSDTYQGYPSMAIHPASGDAIVSWHDVMGASTPEDTNTRLSYDDYALLGIPGFWKTPVTFDQPDPYVEEYIWPYMYIGMAPDYETTGNYRIYQISSQNPDGEIDHSILRWIDVPQEDWEYGDLSIMLDKTNWSGPVNILRDWSDPDAGIDCRPYPSFAVDPSIPGHIAIFGYAAFTNGLTGNEIVPQGYYVWDSYDGGETWSYDNFHSYETDVGMLNEYVLYAVENVPGFTDDEGNPFDALHVWVGWPGNNCSDNRTAVFDSHGNLHLPELFWISYVDGNAGSVTYWSEYAFLFQGEVVYEIDGTWEIRHVANMPGTDAWTGLSVPWEIDPAGGDTLIYPWCDIASNDFSPSGYGNFQHQAMNLENGWMVQVWVSGTKLLYAEDGIPGYNDYAEHPIIYLSFSYNNGEDWSAPIELSDIYSTEFPAFSDMITVYPYVDPIIKDLGDGWGQIDMYFFDDNDYGSHIQGVGPNTGGQMVYCSIKINSWPSYLHADFSASPLCGDVPLTVQFTDQSHTNLNVTSRAWDFDYDGIVDSYDRNPQWTYTDPGSYTVSLAINGSKSKYVDTEVKVDYITVYGDDNIINIPEDYATIQEGINAADEGDTVLVDPGTYVENINFNGKNITVASLYLTTQDTSYISQTIIDGDSLDSVVRFISGEGLSSVIKGFTITNGFANDNNQLPAGGGVKCVNSSPTIENNIIKENKCDWYVNGGGIYCENSESYILNNIICDNEGAYYGAGIFISDSCAVTIKGNVIYNNITASGYGISYGGGIYCGSNRSSILIENNTICNNIVDFGEGGGIYSNTLNTCVVNTIVWDNTPDEIAEILTIQYSDIQGGWAGMGNIDSNPLFVNPTNGDYHLSWAHYPIIDSTKSPCIDAGDPNSPLDPDGTIADMGAYYFNQNVSIDEPAHSSEYNLTFYPNPIRQGSNNLNVCFALNKPCKVKIQIYNIKGQLVSTLLNENLQQGDYSMGFSTNDLSSGIYFASIHIDGMNRRDVRKIVMLK